MSAKDSKKKTGRGGRLPFWLSGNPTGYERHFIQLGESLLQHPAYLNLTPAARQVYHAMICEAGFEPFCTFPLHIARKYGIENSSLRRAVQELLDAGFVVRERRYEPSADGKRYRQTANTYSFISEWKKGGLKNGAEKQKREGTGNPADTVLHEQQDTVERAPGGAVAPAITLP